MPRPRTPSAKAALTGADKVNPGRFRSRSEPKASGKDVGKPPSYFNREAKAAWQDFAAELGWLTYEDRGALEVASLARGQMREMVKAKEPLTASFISALNTAIGKLGASPTDRGKVFQRPEEEEEDDPFAAFDGRVQ